MKLSNTDKQNLEAFLSGDRKGAEAVVATYASPLINHAMHMLAGDRAKAEDIVQDCFVKLWKNAQKLLDNEGALYLRAWLFRVATNAVLDMKRQPRTQDDTVLEFVDSGEASAETMAIREERARYAMQLVNDLPERQRAAVLMSHFEGMGNSEIGKVLDISVEAVESLLSRARRNMRAEASQLKEVI